MHNQLSTVDMSQYISLSNNQLVTPSTRIAQVFNKEHRNILRSIRSLDCSDYFNALNFERVEFKDAKGEMREMYNITKDGFFFLVMGFTGKQAAAIKEAYINAFNAMAAQLANTGASSSALLAMQQTNQALQSELLQLYREKIGYLERPATLHQNQQTPTVHQPQARLIYVAQSKQEFITKVKRALAEQPGLTKTALLEAVGSNKGNKTTRAWLDEFTDIHWQCTFVATRYTYYLLGSCINADDLRHN